MHADWKVVKSLDKWSIEPVTTKANIVSSGMVLIPNILNKFAIDHEPVTRTLSFNPVEDRSNRFITNVGRYHILPQVVTVDNAIPSMEFIQHYMRGTIRLLTEDNSDWVDNKIFFSGKLEKGKPQREIYEILSKQHPELFVNNNNDLCERKWIEPEDHKKYKYLIDLQGHTYSSRSLWLLFAKRVFFASEYQVHVHSWEEKLKPYVHYIPVAPDLSDLIEKYNWIESNPQEYNKITNAAFRFAVRFLSNEAFCKNIIRCFVDSQDYSEIYKIVSKKLSEISILPEIFLTYNRFVTENVNGLQGLKVTDNIVDLRYADVLLVNSIDDMHPIEINKINYYYPNSLFIKDLTEKLAK